MLAFAKYEPLCQPAFEPQTSSRSPQHRECPGRNCYGLARLEASKQYARTVGIQVSLRASKLESKKLFLSLWSILAEVGSCRHSHSALALPPSVPATCAKLKADATLARICWLLMESRSILSTGLRWLYPALRHKCRKTHMKYDKNDIRSSRTMWKLEERRSDGRVSKIPRSSGDWTSCLDSLSCMRSS
ncbi:hypothetical protein CC80DRAFT_68148 [Byssothecium circinans]|uniref:Uncharacterized protein n=1 Tax=Byssothecium circinans TaxID=147558 RepID=A0A6A5TWP0_9PLEO|nr:hypothetical protein CC80DRAFT_68148 [Byssothecium circinans]